MNAQQMIAAADGQALKSFKYGNVEVRLVRVGVSRERADFYLNSKRTDRRSAMHRLQA